MPDSFDDVFTALKEVMCLHTAGFTAISDEPGKYYLVSPTVSVAGKPFWIGGVEIKKNYVSYHLMPVYCCPGLLASVSPELKARMQGKSCFNFKKLDPVLFNELGKLTADGIEAIKNLDFSKFSGSCS